MTATNAFRQASGRESGYGAALSKVAQNAEFGDIQGMPDGYAANLMEVAASFVLPSQDTQPDQTVGMQQQTAGPTKAMQDAAAIKGSDAAQISKTQATTAAVNPGEVKQDSLRNQATLDQAIKDTTRMQDAAKQANENETSGSNVVGKAALGIAAGVVADMIIPGAGMVMNAATAMQVGTSYLTAPLSKDEKGPKAKDEKPGYVYKGPTSAEERQVAAQAGYNMAQPGPAESGRYDATQTWGTSASLNTSYNGLDVDPAFYDKQLAGLYQACALYSKSENTVEDREVAFNPDAAFRNGMDVNDIARYRGLNMNLA